MQDQALNNPLSHWLQPVGTRIRRAIERHPPLRLAALAVLNGGTSLLLLTPALMVVGASLAAVWLSRNTHGPLDWFMVEVLGALALAAAGISVQQYLTRPRQAEGIVLDPQQSPQLFGMLERRVAHFQLQPPDEVRLTDAAELAVHEIPHCALPFGHRRILRVGAPLLFFLSGELFRLALAGAVAAQSRKQRGFNGWILRRCDDWPQLIDAFRRRPGLTARLFCPLLQQVTALNEILCRELRAEQQQSTGRWVAKHADTQQAEHLLASQVLARLYLKRQYWPMIMKAADRCPTPVVKPFSHFGLLLNKTLNRDTATRWLLQAQTCNPDNRELRDLLAGLGMERLDWPGLPQRTASDRLLSADILKALDSDWQQRVQPQWDEHHARFQHDLKRFKQLQQQHAAQPLHGELAMRYVQLAKRLVDSDKATTICTSICATNRSDAALQFACGCQLVEAGQARAGCEALQRAAELDRSLAHRAHALINKQNRAWLDEDQRDYSSQA